LTILVVDDEPLIRWSLRRALTERGHVVVAVGSAGEAIAALGTHATRFDVAILDYHLPDRHDLSLLDDVRTLSPSTAVVMMTAFADDGMRAGAQDRGALAVVDKPFQIRSFVALVEAAIG
jgi:DNA-binding NtrC family response regulator